MATSLGVGDLAFVQYNSDTAGAGDMVSFVLLVAIDADTVINFTETGINGAAFMVDEGGLSWTPDVALPAGTVVALTNTTGADLVIDSAFNASTGAPLGTVTNLPGGSTSGISINSSGESIMAFQGAMDPANLIYGINMGGEDTTVLGADGWNVGATTDGNESNLPDQLNAATNGGIDANFGGYTGLPSDPVEVDNGIYTGPTAGTADVIRAAIADINNWTFNNTGLAQQVFPVFAVNGLDSDDTIVATAAMESHDGGGGTDAISFINSNVGVTVDLNANTGANGDAAGDTFANFESITGSAFGDILTGTNGINILQGGGGADTINGLVGDDTIDGGSGNDTMDGGTGTDTASYESAAAGVDVSLATQGVQRDTVSAGLDTLTNFENLTGSGFADVLTGDGNVNVINGGDGNDIIRGGGGADVLNGGADDDIIFFDASDASVDGGSGYDRLFTESGSGALNINLATSNLEYAQGGGGADVLNAALVGEAVKLWGHGGGDALTGSAFADYIDGGSGHDNLIGLGGADILDGSTGADVFNGGAGDDIMYIDADDTTIDGGADYDRVYVRGYSAGVDVDMTAGNLEYANGNTLDDTFNATGATWSVKLFGQGGNDTLAGGDIGDQLYGSDGIDVISGNGGNDIISGGTGADQLSGGAGDDIIFVDVDDALINGGADYDRVYVTAGSAGVTINMTAADVEFAYGAAGDDVFNAAGSTVAVKLQGRDGADTLTGGNLADLIYGGTGADNITGGTGNDFLSGGGADGAIDTFFFASGWGDDTLADFQNGQDLMNLASLGTDFAALTITALGANNSVVSFGGDSITLLGMQLADVDAGDFVFV